MVRIEDYNGLPESFVHLCRTLRGNLCIPKPYKDGSRLARFTFRGKNLVLFVKRFE